MIGSEQFSLSFNKRENKLKTAIDSGGFSVLFEIEAPSKDCDIATVLGRYEGFLNASRNSESFNVGLCITDRKNRSDLMGVLDFASDLIKDEERGNHLLSFSGRGKDKDEILDTLKNAASAGFQNFLAVSGNIYKSDSVKNLKSESFSESVSILKSKQKDATLSKYVNIGASVNPFKYSQRSFYPTMEKLIKKIDAGASFIVTQAGWDILKNQEVRWYLESRGHFEQCFARIILLKPDIIEQIITGTENGVFFSPDFLGILKKESKFGIGQFWASQWRRLELLISGLRLMGYSGVVIAGIETETHLSTALNKIKMALSEFKNFAEWRDVYLNFVYRSEMAPYPYKYYKYKNLLKEAFADSAEVVVDKKESLSITDKFKYRAIDYKAFLDYNLPLEADKKIVSLAAKYCPKKMLYGACGEVSQNGSCCFDEKRECLFSIIYQLAVDKGDFL